MAHRILSSSGTMACHCVRLRRGDDLLLSIRALARQKNIRAGVILSAEGCISEGKVREISDHCEIVSLMGTVSRERCHLHIALSKEDLSTIGGHLCAGCIVNTTCELVIAEIPHSAISVEFDRETGYDELIFTEV